MITDTCKIKDEKNNVSCFRDMSLHVALIDPLLVIEQRCVCERERKRWGGSFKMHQNLCLRKDFCSS